LTIFLGDFTPGQAASYEIAGAMIEWAKRKECEYIVTAYSMPIGLGEAEHDVTAVVNGSNAEGKAEKAGLPFASLAAVGGTAGRLLLLGREAEIPVVALLIRAHKDLEDYEAGLKLAETVMRLVPSAQCDLTVLRDEARRTEEGLRNIQAHSPAPDVYQ
jgi:predicted ATP-grasp superfamily ATP-dependent carboligase